MEEGKINGLTEHSLRTLGGIADADTVLGTPVFTASGAQIVPFSKVTFGNLSGGGEYGDVKVIKEAGDRSFFNVESNRNVPTDLMFSFVIPR